MNNNTTIMSSSEFYERPETRRKIFNFLSSKGLSVCEYELCRRIPHSLFSYCTLNKYILENLMNNQLTFTTPFFNDIYGSTVHADSVPIFRENMDKLNSFLKDMGPQ